MIERIERAAPSIIGAVVLLAFVWFVAYVLYLKNHCGPVEIVSRPADATVVCTESALLIHSEGKWGQLSFQQRALQPPPPRPTPQPQ